MKIIIGVSYFLVLLVVFTFAGSPKPSMYKVRFLEYAKCDDTNSVIQFEDLNINRVGIDDYVLTGLANITKKNDGPLVMGVDLWNCPEEEGKECTFYGSYKYEDLCEELKNENSDAYDWLNNTFNIPNPKCPLEKHVYNIETDSVDMSKYEDVTSTALRWKMKLIFYYADLKTVNSCLFLHVKIEPKTKKERSRDNKKWKQKQKEEGEGSEKEGS